MNPTDYNFKYPCYYFHEKYKDPEDGINLNQRNIMGILYFKKWRSEVVYNDKSLLALFDGRHRSGKSLSAITLACLIDKTFWQNFEHRIVQTPQEFMDAIKVIEKENTHGNVIIVDEAGVSMSSDMWYESFMKCIQKTIEVLGYLNVIIFFCAPVSSFIDSKLRKMSHYYIRVKRFSKKETNLSIYELNWSMIKKDFIYRIPKVNFWGQKIYLRRVVMSMPPSAIIERYRELEQSRKRIIIKDLSREVERSTTMSKLVDEDLSRIIEDIIKAYKEFVINKSKSGRVAIDSILVSKRFGIGKEDANYISKEASRIINEQNDIDKQIDELKVKEKEKQENLNPIVADRTNQMKKRRVMERLSKG